jgi:hypothetical protein
LNGPEVEQRGAPHEFDEAIRRDARNRHHDVAAHNGNLSLSNPEAIDALSDDLLRLLNLHVSNGLTSSDGLGRQNNLRTATEVKTEFRRHGMAGPKRPCS